MYYYYYYVVSSSSSSSFQIFLFGLFFLSKNVKNKKK